MQIQFCPTTKCGPIGLRFVPKPLIVSMSLLKTNRNGISVAPVQAGDAIAIVNTWKSYVYPVMNGHTKLIWRNDNE
jgi:hypothetical protein